MPAQVAIIHGWSDTSASFRSLRKFLLDHGYQATQIWLGDYVSMDDDVRVEDVGRRMEYVVRKAIADGRLSEPFDLIVHSTGGLVAREWISRYYPLGTGCPVKRLLMLAPANFGSALASLGKSMIGRVAKGWNNWFQTGAEMLRGLELASPYQWDLTCRDVLDPAGTGDGPYGAGKIWPFVLVGTRGYDSGLRKIINEYGADGTVRCAAANLNAVGLTVDFASDPAAPSVRPWHRRSGDLQFPFAILPDRDHTSIHEPAEASGASEEMSNFLGNMILAALNCQTIAQYRALAAQWDQRNERIYQLTENSQALDEAFPKNPPARECFHQYIQVITYVHDDQGQPVNDYFLEFFSPERAADKSTVYFHSEVLEDVHVNSQLGAYRCLFVDRTDLMLGFYPAIRATDKREVAVSLSAAELGPNVRYFDSTKVGAKGHLIIHREDDETREDLPARLYRNRTHLIEIVIPRQPTENVFKLSR